MTASDSFSSVTNRSDAGGSELPVTERMPPLAAALLQQRDLDLLAPVRLLAPGAIPRPESPTPSADRGEVAAALAVANSTYGHPAAERLARQLADSRTRVVITGQQPGLFGGPLYTLSKAVAATLWAERLRETGVPAVPLFWMATEDHDFREVSQAFFYSTAEPVRFDLGTDEQPLRPVGQRRLGPRVDEVRAALAAAVPGERFARWADRLGVWYRAEATFGEAFAGLMTHLLGARCPLLVDSMLPAVKTAQRPWLRRLVERESDLAVVVAERDRRIGDRGYPLQITPQPDALPLFVIYEGERRRVERRGEGRFGLRGRDDVDEPADWLLGLVEREPERVSPGVRARPAIQDAIFGTDLQVVGPGELAYLPQAAPLFELLETPAPWAVPRPRLLVLEEHQADKLEATDLTLDELVDPDLDLDARLARPEQTAFVEAARAGVRAVVEGLEAPAVALDPNLERPWRKTRDQTERALENFGAKVTAAAARRDQTTRQRIETLRSLCLPLGRPQERVIAAAHYPGKYGERFVEALFEQIDLDRSNLQVISPYGGREEG